jgi:hypothetical protein
MKRSVLGVLGVCRKMGYVKYIWEMEMSSEEWG